MLPGQLLWNFYPQSSNTGKIFSPANAEDRPLIIILVLHYLYRVTCNSTRSSSSLQTPDGTIFNLAFNALYPYTNYTCCVETLYTDVSENAFACAMNTTYEGGMSYNTATYNDSSNSNYYTCIIQCPDLLLL